MKTIQEAVDEVKAVKTDLATYFDKVLAAVNRLEAKILAGADAQSIVDELQPIKEDLVTKGAEMDITGV